jgi:hypothetical protein
MRRWIGRKSAPIASAAILAVLVPQFVVSILGFPIRQGLHKSWPFIDYPMYSHPHYEGEKISRPVVIAVREDMKEMEIGPDDLGIQYWFFVRFVLALQRNNDTVIREYARVYEEKQGTKLAGFRVEDRGLLLSRDDVEPAPMEILADWTFAAPKDN